MSRTLEAPNVQMSLEMDEEVVMRMGDDGRRFELVAHERACPGTSLGLTEIAEQVFPVQGRLAINSRSLRGTRIEVRVPLEGVAVADAC